jgi:hypothetical protein
MKLDNGEKTIIKLHLILYLMIWVILATVG